MKLTTLFLFILISLLFSSPAWANTPDEALPSYQTSKAYQRYLQGPRSEMAKLLYLMDRFVNTPFAVIYDGTVYDANTAVEYARSYIAKNFHKEKAESWIKIHAHRSGSGRLIYIRYPNGERRPASEVLLEELKLLNATSRI